MTVIEICLPLLFAAILIALRHRVHSVRHPNATIYPPESVDDLPGFFSRRPPSSPWELAYVPSNSSAVRSIAEAVERALPVSIRGEQGSGAAASAPGTGTNCCSDKAWCFVPGVPFFFFLRTSRQWFYFCVTKTTKLFWFLVAFCCSFHLEKYCPEIVNVAVTSLRKSILGIVVAQKIVALCVPN